MYTQHVSMLLSTLSKPFIFLSCMESLPLNSSTSWNKKLFLTASWQQIHRFKITSAPNYKQQPPCYSHYSGQAELADTLQLRTGGFRWCKVLLSACPCWRVATSAIRCYLHCPRTSKQFQQNFVGAKFHCPHALADGNHLTIRDVNEASWARGQGRGPNFFFEAEATMYEAEAKARHVREQISVYEHED